MADKPDLDKFAGGSQGAPSEPPSKKPCLNTSLSTAVQDMALAPADDGSDFYNTPLMAGTPVHANATGAATSTDHGESTTPPKSATLIPGLSLFNDSLQAPQSVDDTLNATKKEAVSANHEQMVETVSHNNSKTDMINHGVSEGRDDTLESGDAMDTEEAVVMNGNKVDSGDLRDEQATAQAEDNVSGAAAEVEGEEEHPEWEIDSSPIESSSDSSTDSSDESDEDEEEDDYPILSAEETARILMQAEGGSDDEADGKIDPTGSHVRTTHEQPEEILPIPDVTITPDMKVVHLGHVETIVENVVLIKASVSGEYQVLESNSVLCLEDRTIIGVVSDTLGRVEEPLYTVRFPDPEKIAEFGLSHGKPIFYVESHSTFVFTQPLKGMKGSDASNFHDEEVGEDEMEFSDDEAEAEYRRKLKQKRKEKKDGNRGEPGSFGRPRREPPGPSKLGQTELNYDDEDGGAEDGYTPLARPKNLHEMMGHQEAPVEGAQYSTRGSRGGRGRGGRGFDRGSGRGRGGGRGNRTGGSRDSHHYHNHHSQDINHRSNHPPGREGSSQGSPVNQQQPTTHHSEAAAPYQGHHQPFAYSAANAPTQQFAPFAMYPQQQQQPQPYGQVAASMPQFPQLPIQMPYQPNPYSQIPAGSHINPAFFAALQQQQQQQNQTGPAPGVTQGQNSPTSSVFDQVKAQLDILRHLSGGGGGPPAGGSGR